VSLSAIPQLSIVIPIGKVDQLDGNLLRSIAAFEQQAELIVVCGRAPTQAEQVALVHWKKHRWLQTKWGRALQLNAGCKAACGRWIWMLHADSILDAVALQSVQNRLRTDSRDLFYFSLRFRQDGPESVRLNAVAANIRSALLKIPFGDQGFLIMKESLSSLGWLRTDLPFGEDRWARYQAPCRDRRNQCAQICKSRVGPGNERPCCQNVSASVSTVVEIVVCEIGDQQKTSCEHRHRRLCEDFWL